MKRYSNIKQQSTKTGTQYLQTVKYPNIAPTENDYYIISSATDRYDILAKQFYGDSTLWWVIAAANTVEKFSLNIPPGIQIRIPNNKDFVVNTFLELNK